MTVQTVLVVDDERHIVDLLTELLEEEGYHVVRAYDGEAALHLVHQSPPDLVIADVMMPRLDGLALARLIRETHRSVPIILMSAAVTPRDAGISFVPKPFDIDQFLTVVGRVLA